MITDATIRRWCGPKWRIGASRRTRALLLAELQARHESGSPLQAKNSPNWVKCLDQGTSPELQFRKPCLLKSVDELKIWQNYSRRKKAYEFFRNRYQSHWSTYFDPIAGQLIIEDDNIEGDLSVLPLIGGSDYRQMVQTVGQVKLKGLGRPSPKPVSTG